MAETEGTLARLRRGHVRDAWAINPERCLLDSQPWPCDTARLLDVAETSDALHAVLKAQGPLGVDVDAAMRAWVAALAALDTREAA